MRRHHNVTVAKGQGSHTYTVWDFVGFPADRNDPAWELLGTTVPIDIWRGECSDCLWIDKWWKTEEYAHDKAQRHADNHKIRDPNTKDYPTWPAVFQWIALPSMLIGVLIGAIIQGGHL